MNEGETNIVINFAKPRKMEEIDLVSKDTVADLIKQKFESPLPKCQDDDDPFVKVTRIENMTTLLYLYPG